MRHRHSYMYFGSLIVLALWMLTDPDLPYIKALPLGASTVATVLILLKSVLYITVLQLSVKCIFDYLHLTDAVKKAMQTSSGAGKVVMGAGLIFISFAIAMYAAVSR